jgi:excisionase family DNA binding protein
MALAEILTTREVCVLLGCHYTTIIRLARRGAIPAFKIGSDYRFRRDALLTWMDAGGSIVSPPARPRRPILA